MKAGKQSRLFEFGFGKTRAVVDKAEYPINSLCFSCGKNKWLNWVLDGNQVCDDCAKPD
ncbi:MAG: hypothetical protein ABH851_01055 [Methanobacteriota archaeon]